MRNKITIIIISFVCLLVGIFVILQLLDTKEPPNKQILDNTNNTGTETANENEENRQIFDSYGIHNQNMIQYGSTKYNFTIDVPREFYCSLTPDVLWGGNTVICQRQNDNSSDSQEDYLSIEIFSTGYDSSKAGEFEDWYAEGIAQYYARELEEATNSDSHYTLTHETTTTNGEASYVYFSNGDAVISIGSSDVDEVEILEIVKSFQWLDKDN
ncbi:MAG: hypothetical protein WCT33_04255 [Patescibacteria group bacterium]